MLAIGESMLYSNINKNLMLVIFWLLVSVSALSCGPIGVGRGTPPAFDRDASEYLKPQRAGRIESAEINESSGIAASQCQPNVLWTHNDSGDGPYIFAMDPAGHDLGTWRVENAENTDWEDIAVFKDMSGNCFLYIGDIGNSKKETRRTEQRIYKISEPKLPEGGKRSSRNEPNTTAAAEVIVFSYPDGTHDAETLMVAPRSETIYVITKSRNGPASVYKVAHSFGGPPVRADKISDITVPAIPNGFLTGGDIAPDGGHAVVCDYFAAYEFSLPSEAKSFDEIWKQKPRPIELGDRSQGESIGYSADGKALFATSEGSNGPLIRVDRRQ